MNKRGFAISVVLYAMVILVIGVLYLLLGIVKNRYTVGNYLKEAIINNIVDLASSGETVGKLCNNGSTLIVNKGVDDGLRQDPTDSSRYIYSGSNPNNYLEFNNQTWRIVSIESDGRIKIVLDDVYTTSYYQSGSTDISVWTDTLMYKLLNTNTDSFYSTISEEYVSYIAPSTWNVGKIDSSTTSTIQNLVTLQKATVTEEINVGLLNSTDFLLGSSDNDATTARKTIGGSTYYVADTNNWLWKSGSTSSYWLMNPAGTTWMWRVYGDYGWMSPATGSSILQAVRPVVFLKNTTLLNGSGTSDDKYRISTECGNSTTATCNIVANPGTYNDSQTLTINVNANGATIKGYSWNMGSFTTNNTLNTSSSGIYQANIRDSSGGINTCAIELVERQEYKVTSCLNENKKFGSWYTGGEVLAHFTTDVSTCTGISQTYAEDNYMTWYRTFRTVTGSNGVEFSCYYTTYSRSVSCNDWTNANVTDWAPANSNYPPTANTITIVEERTAIGIGE